MAVVVCGGIACCAVGLAGGVRGGVVGAASPGCVDCWAVEREMIGLTGFV